MRVHELAKEMELTSKELLARLRELGVDAASHMSALDETAIELMREAHGAPRAKTAAPSPQPPPPPQSAPPPPEVKPSPPPQPAHKPPLKIKVIKTRGPIVVRELAEKIGIRPNELIAELMGMNVLASITERVNVPVAEKIAEKHGFVLKHEKRAEEHRETLLKRQKTGEIEEEDRPEDLVQRPPVVTFMGHVDHGKTSLLDRIRNTAVAKGEEGGITQHIGAYTIDISGRSITFLDTPGHAAFTAMRARGANLTDIAVIVVAADDGVMPQTREAIMHAKAAQVAMLVAINKMDLPTANMERVKTQLQSEGLAPEEWGGDIICAPVSAQTGEGIEHFLEMIILQADILELKANPKRRAGGFVVESQLEPGMGPTATLLVTAGTLTVGDAVFCDRHWGRLRGLINDHGIKVKSALPSTPVKCLGLSGVPDAGAEFRVCASDKEARTLAEEAAAQLRRQQLTAPKRASLQDLFDRLGNGEKLQLNLIVKADTNGSVEALTHALGEIRSNKVSLNFILSAAGNITENDVMLAAASNAVILGFRVAKEPGVDSAARHEAVEIRLHGIIYELIDEVRKAMTGLLAPEIKETILGHAQIKQVFQVGKTGKVAGCLVTDGAVSTKFKVRVKRGDEALYEGAVNSLRHFQDAVSEVSESKECGIRLDKFANFEVGDILEFYRIEEVEQTL